ncbi:HNH endonuclease [Nocardia carnea]|uniref:HNH endonuclease n=1 Tax=Nocardia carnea TaxID=37328 RepID=UPI00245779E1|nr:HNH endonuclease signature motif containing protein [Nocardia carnea]
MSESTGRSIVNERCWGRCERCGRPGQTTIHHRRKKGQGGLWAPSNLLALCGHGTAGCHGWVEANPTAAHEAGLWLFYSEIATEVRVPLWWWPDPVRLTDDGSYDIQE